MFLSDEGYQQALRLKSGAQPGEPLKTFADWALETLKIRVVSFQFEPMKNDSRKRLYVVLDGDEDYKKVHRGYMYNPEIQKRVAQKFAALCQETPPDGWQPQDRIFVAFCNLADEIRPKILESVRREIQQAKERFPQAGIRRLVNDFGSLHIFYGTDRDVEENAQSGVSGQIQAYCDGLVLPLDKFHVFPNGVPCIFTSEQTLNEQFDGNLFYYFR